MKMHTTTILFSIVAPVVTHADTGLIAIAGEDPVALQISVPSSSAYKLSYDPARISVWDTVTKDNLIAPNAEFATPAVKGDAEPDCDIDLDDFAGFQRCFGNGPLGPGCGVFDFEPDTDIDLTDFASLQPTIAGPEDCVPVSVTVFVEGLTASTTLGDAPIDVLADPDGDSTFTLQSTEEVTVASLTISPSSGPAGTPLAITLQPAIGPLAFDASTTLDWNGVFQPLVGAPTSPFQVAYNVTQFRESSSSHAVVIVGDGATTNAPDFQNVEGPGTTPGVFTFNLASVTLMRSFDLAPELDTGRFEEVDYPDGPGGTTPPSIDGDDGKPGHVAMRSIARADGHCLRRFAEKKITKGATLKTDGWGAYRSVVKAGYSHEATVTGSGKVAAQTFPWLHTFIANMKRMILGTYHRVSAKHLDGYLAEFGYRTNRRWLEASLFDRLIAAAVGSKAVTYKELVAGGS